jgi:phenol 2-monooxygenase
VESLKVGGRVDKSKIRPAELLETARKAFAPYTFETPESFDWWTLYIIGQRVASKFSIHERVLISGDACHTHSPKAGQGMNASMNDTHNLAWKLVHVLRGWADISLLKTYEFERRQYARDLIDFDKKFSALFSGKPRSELNLEGVTHEEFMKAFQTFGGFTSGIGVRYASSQITGGSSYQSLASEVAIGARMPPQVILRAADSRPIQVQDLLVSDTRFKLLLFLGDLSDNEQRTVVDEVAVALPKILDSFHRDMFDVITISLGGKMAFDYTRVPASLRSHWTKVHIDDTDATGTQGGCVYEEYGINRQRGVVVLVRPDGYVGLLAPLTDVEVLDDYLGGFLIRV